MQVSPLRTRHQIELHETPQREARLATLEIRAIQVQVKPPNHRSGEPIITHNMVLVQEVNGPDDGTDVSWMLITTLNFKVAVMAGTATSNPLGEPF